MEKCAEKVHKVVTETGELHKISMQDFRSTISPPPSQLSWSMILFLISHSRIIFTSNRYLTAICIWYIYSCNDKELQTQPNHLRNKCNKNALIERYTQNLLEMYWRWTGIWRETGFERTLSQSSVFLLTAALTCRILPSFSFLDSDIQHSQCFTFD